MYKITIYSTMHKFETTQAPEARCLKNKNL